MQIYKNKGSSTVQCKPLCRRRHLRRAAAASIYAMPPIEPVPGMISALCSAKGARALLMPPPLPSILLPLASMPLFTSLLLHYLPRFRKSSTAARAPVIPRVACFSFDCFLLLKLGFHNKFDFEKKED